MNEITPESPIGIFDSGLGGLTVLKSLTKILPNESFIYLGDTAHVPYGNKSDDTIIRYSNYILEFFLSKNTKAIVIACNTASAIACNELRNNYNIPIFDVVTPSVEYSNKISVTRHIGVIGTNSTINSKAYTREFENIKSDCSITEISCPLFVPIIEEDWSQTTIAKDIAFKYLQPFNKTKIDTLILGCTHYPIMSNIIQNVINNNIQLVFSGQTVGEKLFSYLEMYKNQNNQNKSDVCFYLTDFPQKFDKIGSQFLGQKLSTVKHIVLF